MQLSPPTSIRCTLRQSQCESERCAGSAGIGSKTADPSTLQRRNPQAAPAPKSEAEPHVHLQRTAGNASKPCGRYQKYLGSSHLTRSVVALQASHHPGGICEGACTGLKSSIQMCCPHCAGSLSSRIKRQVVGHGVGEPCV